MVDKTENILSKIINSFNEIAGIDAIVLGGSRATGTANKDSDIDIGIYYDKALESEEQIANNTFQCKITPTVTEYCEKWLVM